MEGQSGSLGGTGGALGVGTTHLSGLRTLGLGLQGLVIAQHAAEYAVYLLVYVDLLGGVLVGTVGLDGSVAT